MNSQTLFLVALVSLQGCAALLLVIRLLPGRTRRPPIEPLPGAQHAGRVTVVVTSLDEVHRIGPCLDGLRAQGPAMLEALIVDSRSTDGTWDLIQAAAALDARIRPMHDDPLPPEWVGKVWALEHGLRHARGEWVLGIDADTTPQPGLVAAAVNAAEAMGYDAVSFAPRFTEMTVAEQWLQPAMLVTLVYRFGAAGERAPAPDRVMANGQCFLARRSTLIANGGYSSARRSWCDDVTLARHMARNGARVGFLDGSMIISVRAYSGIGQMWREWGRSIDLKDGTTPFTQFLDVCFVLLTQFVPLPAVVLAGLVQYTTGWPYADPIIAALIGLMVLPRTYTLMRHALRVLMEVAPPGCDVAAAEARLASLPGVTSVHDLHIWTVTDGIESASAHIVVADGADWHGVLDHAREVLAQEYGVTHATIQVEPHDHDEQPAAV